MNTMDQAEVERLIQVKYKQVKPDDGREWRVDPYDFTYMQEALKVIGTGTYAQVTLYENFAKRKVRLVGSRKEVRFNGKRRGTCRVQLEG